MAYQSEISKVLEIPTNFYIGHLIGGKGKTIRDIQELTGAEIIIPNPNPSKTLEIRGSRNAVKFAEEFVLAFFKHQNPSQGSDGLHNSYPFLFGIISNLPTGSISLEKLVKSGFF